MFHNRISRFQFPEPTESEEVATSSSAFAAIPAFAMAGTVAACADIYRWAHQQAQEQVSARRERARRAQEWN